MVERILIKLVLVFSLVFSGCESSSPDVREVVVIGGGLMGSSAGWHLSNQGFPVVLLEMQDTVYTQGSSYGEARIARSNNRGNDIWSYLHNRSVNETQVLVDYLNSTGNGNPFSINDIYTTSPVTYVGSTRIYDRLLSSLIRQKVNYDLAITPEEGEAQYDVNLPDNILIQREYNQHSGTMNPKRLIQLLHLGILKKGGTLRYNSKVSSVNFNEEKDWYEITILDQASGEEEVLYTKKVVSAVGPYTGRLLKDIAPYFEELINPQRVFLAFLKIKASSFSKLSDQDIEKLKSFYPVINSSKGRDDSFFSMIEYYDENNHPVIKIGGHFQRSEIQDLDQVWKKELSEREVQWSMNSTAAYMDLLKLDIKKEDLELLDGYSCVYSLTDSEVPLVTPLKTQANAPNANFIVMGGMSGVGAKGAMTYGHIAANQMLSFSEEPDSLYHITSEALGFTRLLEEKKN